MEKSVQLIVQLIVLEVYCRNSIGPRLRWSSSARSSGCDYCCVVVMIVTQVVVCDSWETIGLSRKGRLFHPPNMSPVVVGLAGDLEPICVLNGMYRRLTL